MIVAKLIPDDAVALVRCLQKHSPPTSRRSNPYVFAALPVGYPKTAAICGIKGCKNAGVVWLNQPEHLAYSAGERIFGGPSNFVKVRVEDATDRARFEQALSALLATVPPGISSFLDVKAGRLHSLIGGYPGKKHRMVTCCDVMRKAMEPGDAIIAEPPMGKGANLVIRYRLHKSRKGK